MDITSVNSISATSDLSRSSALDTASKEMSFDTKLESGFGASVKDAATSFVKTLENAEATSIMGIKGEATTFEVASAVMEAEQALKMTIAVRDKIVSAYLEISRMQI